jgi:hypothetical protein
MTVTDHPNKSGGLGEGGFGPRRRPPGTRGAVAKVDADVADLLGVSALNPSALPAAPAPDEGAANDLLDTLVQDHLERSTGPVFPAAPEAGGGDRADLLQKEIEALLAGDPLDDAPRENGAVQAAAEPAPLAADADRMALEEVAGMEILRPGREPSLSDAELSVLLPGEVSETGAEEEAVAGTGRAVEAEPLEALAGDASAAEEVARELLADASMSATGPSAEAPALPMDESEESIAAAEGALADELAALERESAAAAAAANAAPAVEAPIAEVPAGTADEIAAGVEQALAAVAVREEPVAVAARTAPPVVILQPDEPEEEEAAPGVWKRAWRSVSDMALMVAQLVDLPFSWISGLDKHILGVAAVVFFFSGLLLVVLGWWLGAR